MTKYKINFYFNRPIILILTVLVFTAGILYFFSPFEWWLYEDIQYGLNKRISYGFVLNNPTNKPIHDAELWSYVPIKKTATQRCIDIEASRKFELIKEIRGQRILKFSFEVIPPYSRKQVTVRADLRMAEEPQPIPADEPGKWLLPDPFIQSDSEPVQNRTSQFREEADKEIAESILDWVGKKIRYTGFESNEHGAVYALQQEKGDCTEFADLYAALCRAKNIPTRVMAGFFHSGNTVLHRSNYHNWAESYFYNKWHLADPQKGLLDKEIPSYVAMSILGSGDNIPIPRGRLYSVRGKEIEVWMK